MTMKDKLAIHREIESENDRKLKEWKEIQKLNEQLAEEEMALLISEGVIA